MFPKKSLSSPLYLNALFLRRDEHDETRTSRPNGNNNDEEQREEYFFFLLFFFEK